MYDVLRKTRFSSFSNLLDYCLYSASLNSTKLAHAHLIKLGLSGDTFLGNRLIDIYAKVGSKTDSLRAFDDIESKNIFSWNILLGVHVQSRDVIRAHQLFDGMPERDVVSWNSMILGYFLDGFTDCGLALFTEMQGSGIRSSAITFSILLSFARSACQGKEIHCNMIRSRMNIPSVVGNSLIDMYFTVGLVDYALIVFFTMEELDVISWNTLISGLCKSGCEEMALDNFSRMRDATIYAPDEFTMSSTITACSDLRDLVKGKQVFCFCIKLGFLSNAIVSSAIIDFFSQCNRIEDSVRVFEEMNVWDSSICDSMISSYVKHHLEDKALQIFALSLSRSARPTEFTLSCLISCASIFLPTEHGTQLHSFVVKLGFESDSIVSSSLVEMYSKFALIDLAFDIFARMDAKDLISWNTMIFGLAHNGRTVESVNLFMKLINCGPPPDEITLAGVLLACNFGGFIDKGLSIFSLMDKKFGVIPHDRHFTCVIDMMTKAGEIEGAVEIMEAMPYRFNSQILESILTVCEMLGDLKLTETVAERMMKLEPSSSLPYLVLAKEYERRGRWESLARVTKAMKERKVGTVVECSWVGVKNQLVVFVESEILHPCGEEIYSVTRLLMQDVEDQ